jgi:phage terminase Nu1 subunit (DNA packaging protein)
LNGRSLVLDYIPINSVDDIDPRKISIRDINKRYVDREGNRYATRFNLQTRQVEVVRVARTKSEALRLRDEILRERTDSPAPRSAAGQIRSNPSLPVATASSASAAGSNDGDFDDLDELDGLDLDADPDSDSFSNRPVASTRPPGVDPREGSFIEQSFLEESVQDLGKHRERLQVVINNLKNSRHFDANSAFADILRKIDAECWQKTETVISYYKELYNYPRSLSHYAPRLAPDERARLEKAESDERRMDWVRRWEVRRAFEDIFTTLPNVARELEKLLKDVPDQMKRAMPAAAQQTVSDALVSLDLLVKECANRMTLIQVWKRKFP